MIRSLGVGLILALVLAGCGGGGGGSSASSVVPNPGGGGTTQQAASAKITIVRPAATSQARSAKFIPSSAQSIRVHVLSVNGATPDYNFFPDVIIALSTLNPACTTLSNGGLSCSVTVKVPQSPGVVLQISAYNSTDGSGTAVAVVTTPPVDTTASNPVFNASLGGVPAHLLTDVSVVSGAADGGKHSLTFNVWATDSSNNIILPPGNYPTPITVGTSGDTGGALTPVTTAVASPGPTLGQSTVTVTDDGSKPLTTANITLTSGSLSASVQVNQMLFSPASVSLITPGQSSSISVSEPNYSGAYTLAGNGTNFTFSCAPSNCTPSSAGSAVTFLVTAGANGTGTFTITDSLKGVASVPFAITGQTGGGITSGYPIYQYAVPAGSGSQPVEITLGVDGQSMWFTELNAGNVARFVPSACNTVAQTCLIQEASTSSIGAPVSIAAGNDGNMYFTSQHLDAQIGQVIPATGCPPACTINGYTLSPRGIGTPVYPGELTRGTDGQIYGTQIETNNESYFSLQLPNVSPNDQLFESTTAHYGAITAGLATGNPSGEQNVILTDNQTMMVAIPGRSCSDCGASLFEYGNFTGIVFYGIATARDGNTYVLEADASGNSFIQYFNEASCGVASPTTCTVSAPINIPTAAASAQFLTVGPDGNIWFTESATDKVGVLTTSTHQIKDFQIPGGGAAILRPFGISPGPDGNIWFVEDAAGKVGEVVL